MFSGETSMRAVLPLTASRDSPFSDRGELCYIAVGRDLACWSVWHGAFPLLQTGTIQRRVPSLHCATLKSWARLKCPQLSSVQDFKLA